MTERAEWDMDDLMMKVLDVLVEDGGRFLPVNYGHLLTDLATRVFGEVVVVGDKKYHRMSLVVLRLEHLEFISVQRAFKDESAKANVLEVLRLL